ncbi:MAG TPA: succinylglutamate-semialdehyde dehydrogenase [Sphingomonas sp.]|jgi:succinylglutamic semialdehyde dehydrogenase|nr:succinylglutamate-semialdehyde dehydrogenase [Sphingomonas sp.]
MAQLKSYEPATGTLLATLEIGDVDTEVARARAAQRDWAFQSPTYRAEALRRFANVVRNRQIVLADTIARETGKPLWEAETEVASVINKVEISIRAYNERTPATRQDGDMGLRQVLRHRPHGVIAVLGPYNFPAHLPNGHIVPALLAGNTIVFKPSEQTPATAVILVECLHEAGVPEDAVRLLIGGPDEGRALAGHPGIDGLLFTGSARTGVALNRQFAEDPGRMLALEMGGNNPIVVWDAPDPDAAAAIVVQSAYLSAGQRCTAARRLIVRDGAHEPLVEAIRKLVARIIVDHPHAEPKPFMGPVIDNRAADALEDAAVALVMAGGQPLIHMQRPDGKRPFLTPGLLDVTSIADRPDEELFGPLLQLVRVPDFDAALAEANATRFGLSASLIGGSPELFDQFWQSVRAGVINWNRPTNGASSAAPFGGVGLSGNHRPSAYYAADYCAYPVASVEEENARLGITTGLRDS